ncbi:hypothetical protein Celal_3991 [Cellulophaga algicola DSM 14237]|uniref:DUF2931 family protein n=2 Tax=Cellulophaga TaxID=104264 RepID=E6XD48_CELAD|nr:hypothetical protein Celal_3991 [Cellulophaga algicola DSM 14237]
MHQAQDSYEPIISCNGQSVPHAYGAELKNEFTKEKKVRFIMRYIFFTISLHIIGCKDQKPTKLSEEIEEVSLMNKFEWRPTECAPEHYPVEIYQGSFITDDGDYIVIPSGGTKNNGWGKLGSTWVVGSGKKSIPSKLKIIWVSYTEKQFYFGDFNLPNDKIIKYFKDGYEDHNGIHREYTNIAVGMAPGGVVSVWVMGAGSYIEIGHYKGKKTEVTIEDFNPDGTITLEEYLNNRQLEFSSETKQVIAKEGIPFGKWTNYRRSYNWKPIFKHQDRGVLKNFISTFYNGEFYNIRADDKLLSKYSLHPPSKRIAFSWYDKSGNRYGSEILFDEKEIWNAFEEIYKNQKTTEANLVLEIDKYNSNLNITLESENDTIPIEKSKIKIYNSAD